MKPDKHQKHALRTWYKTQQQVPLDEQLNQAFLQIGIEAGELQKLWVKHMYKPNHSIDREKVVDESFDVYYYLCIICYKYNITIDELVKFGREKLKDAHGWSGSGDKVLNRLEREYGWKPQLSIDND